MVLVAEKSAAAGVYREEERIDALMMALGRQREGARLVRFLVLAARITREGRETAEVMAAERGKCEAADAAFALVVVKMDVMVVNEGLLSGEKGQDVWPEKEEKKKRANE